MELKKEERQEQLLNAVNSMAGLLLESGIDIKDSFLQGMEIVGRCVDVDRIHIWKDELIDGVACYVNTAEWTSESGRLLKPAAVHRAYKNIPEWEKLFPQNKCINGPLSERSKEEKDVLGPQGIKSILAIPLFIQDKAWGFFSLVDCRKERSFSQDEVKTLRSAALMVVSAINRNTQAEQILAEGERMRAFLDGMPLSTQLWNNNINIIDCNDETLKLFELENKQHFFDNFYDYSPMYQKDGMLSRDKVAALIKEAFEEGKVVAQWDHCLRDGTEIPVEMTFVKENYGGEDFVVCYAQDLREHKQIIKAMEKRDSLLNTVNNACGILLQSETGEYEKGLTLCMEMIGRAVKSSRVRIWKNYIEDGNFYCTQLFGWAESTDYYRVAPDINYSEKLPGWQKILSNGECINTIVRYMPVSEQDLFVSAGAKSICVVPVFVFNEFWGAIEYNDCHEERLFTLDEISVLNSASLLMVSSWLKNETTLKIKATAGKLEAVIANYGGIIWCVDIPSNIVTLFDGDFIYKEGLQPKSFEGKTLDEISYDKRFGGIYEGVCKTLNEGFQDFNYEFKDKTYRIRTTPINNDLGRTVSVMGSLDDVTERTSLQAELKAALKDAQNANNAKTAFLARMSHEMRTPLNAILGLSQLALEDESLSEDVQINLNKINNAGSTLLSTVNDILDISKIEAGKFEMVPVDYDIPSLLNDAITQSIMRLGEKPIKFVLNINENLPTRLYGDDLRVKQILNNLLTNAFKYTNEGSVELGVRCEFPEDVQHGDNVVMKIWVSDTGVGIRDEDIKTLFSDYAQVDKKSNRKIEGTGLGLPITKRIAELMGGSIIVQSEFGKGSVFTLEIVQQFISETTIGPEVVNSLKKFSYSDHRRRQHSNMQRIKLPYAKVLVVDDVMTNLDVARGMLRPYGMQVDCASSGRQAIEIVRKAEVIYNAIFMDHMMPDIDGIEAVKIIRKEINTDYAKTVPIIALTANAIIGNEAMFFENGFQAFVSKPIDINRLDLVIREWVRDKELEKKFENENSSNQEKFLQEKKDRKLTMKIHGLDIEKGISLFSGDEEIYLQILFSYIANTKILLNKIRVVGDLNDYAISVHGIKGSSRGICAYIIGDKAEELENAAKKGGMDFVIKHNEEFVRLADDFCTELENSLPTINSNNENSKSRMGSPAVEVLQQLLTACEEGDIDGADNAVKILNSFEYENDGDFVLWLCENSLQMNYTEMALKLKDRIL